MTAAESLMRIERTDAFAEERILDAGESEERRRLADRDVGHERSDERDPLAAVEVGFLFGTDGKRRVPDPAVG